MANTFKNYVLKAAGTTAQNAYTAATGVQLVNGATIAPGGSLVPIGGDQKLVLEANDYLQVHVSSSSSADVITSVLEIT